MSTLQAVVREGFRTRLFQAHAALEVREGVRISREEIGKRVGVVLQADALPQNTIASWFNGILPPADVGAGLAVVYGVKAGWLYFGTEEEAVPAQFKKEDKRPFQAPVKKRRKGSG